MQGSALTDNYPSNGAGTEGGHGLGVSIMTTASQNIRVDEQRLWDSLMAMARIGPGVAGGNNRQTLTPEDGEGRTLFADWCTQAGCTMGVDEMGSMFDTRQGTDSKADPVCIGSHLDTQPTGGKFDGVLGVLAGL